MTIELSAHAPTSFIEANGVKYAYRRLGQPSGVPLVFLQHFTGTMDSWDPVVVDGFAQARPVILFDNQGVSRSSGTTPDTVAAMANDAVAFITALGLKQVDLLGFSLGGFIAQLIAAEHPALVRRLILQAPGPRVGKAFGICRGRWNKRRRPARTTYDATCSSNRRTRVRTRAGLP